MTGVPRSNDLGSRLERLERAVGILQRQSTLTSASIGSGGLTVRDNGSIRGIGTGLLDWQGPADFGGDTHIGGDLVIDGNTALGGNLTFGDSVIPPEALTRRTEARTFGGVNTPGAGTNTFSFSVAVTVPDWAQTTSVIAISTVYAEGTGDATRIGGRVTIAGNAGPDCNAIAYISAVSVPMIHRRDFTPAAGSTFSVVTSGGASPIGATPIWSVNSVVMCVFTKTS